MTKSKPNILRNAKPGTRIFNEETKVYYIKTKNGTWQKDDSFFNVAGRGILRIYPDSADEGSKSSLKEEFSNRIGSDGAYDVTKRAFTINDSSELADLLRTAELKRVNIRDKQIVKDNKKQIKDLLFQEGDNKGEIKYSGVSGISARIAKNNLEKEIARIQSKPEFQSGNNNTPGAVVPMSYEDRLNEFNRPVIKNRDSGATRKSNKPGEGPYPFSIKQLHGVSNLKDALTEYSGKN